MESFALDAFLLLQYIVKSAGKILKYNYLKAHNCYINILEPNFLCLLVFHKLFYTYSNQ